MNTVDLWFTKSKEEVLRSLDTNAAAGLSSQEGEKGCSLSEEMN